MLFNSLQFLIFFPTIVTIYFLLPHRFRWALLLGGSYYFYMCWKPEYVLLIMASTLIDYAAAIQISRSDGNRQRVFLVASLVSNLGILFGFKYFNFFNAQVASVFDSFNIFYGIGSYDLLLPVGISFYTFQSLSYTIDVYRKDREPERHLGRFALYVAFFPQLVAGPIERSTQLLPQFLQKHEFDYQRVTDGMRLILWGLFKKLVIADRLSVYVNEIYNHPGEYQGGHVILATYFFAFQIYCDFSSYSDIAIGASRVMGFKLMENFRLPYYATSISDFWRRWHISLSTWFRDYLYIPLGGSRVSKTCWYRNIMVVFLLSGLWHGANWTYLVWGGLHGCCLVVSDLTAGIRKRACEWTGLTQVPTLHRCLQILFTFHLVAFGWLIFRANSLSDAVILVQSMFPVFPGQYDLLLPAFARYDLVAVVAALVVLELGHLVQQRTDLCGYLRTRSIGFRWTVYYGLAMGIIYFGKYNTSQEFVYFQF